MSFLLPIELAATEVRPGIGRTAEGARASGTLFLSLFTRRRCLRSPVKLAFEMSSTCRKRLTSATLRAGPIAFAHRATRRLAGCDDLGRRKYAVPSD